VNVRAAARSPGAPRGARELRARHPLRRPTPLLVAAWASLLGADGVLGAAGRRRLRRAALAATPAVVALGAGALVALRAFAGRPPLPPVAAAVAGATLLAALAAVAVRRARRAARGAPFGTREQLEAGALAVVASAAAVQLAGRAVPGLEAALRPAIYLTLAVAGGALRPRVALALAGLAVALDAAPWVIRGAPPADAAAHAVRAALALAFALLARAVLAARIAAAARAEAAAVAVRLAEIDERARAWRVLGGGADAAREDAERRTAEAAVVEVEGAVRGALEVAEAAVRAHTAAVFVASPDGRELRLHECRSASDGVARGPLAAEGALGAALRGAAVRLEGAFGAAWYDDGTRPGAALAVPLVDRGGHPRGVLLADRLGATPFDARDERVLATLAAEILRAMQGERLLADVRRARDESERFFQALERLNRTAKAREAFDAVLEIAAAAAPVDFGAVTLAEPGPAGAVRHAVARVRADEEAWAALEGLAFDDGPGLVASAVRLGATLPARDVDPARAAVFDAPARLRGLGSLRVLPLRTADRVLGTVVLGARRRAAYGAETVRQLEVVAMQAAEAILRARLFDETERLATTDGLTGLLNHRAFQARFEEEIAHARRYDRNVSVLLVDVDHFKKVNDTHGHPAGDEVLRGVAGILAREARSTDLAARYGGEEFAVLMPETDLAGALAVAERIRVRVAASPFPTARGALAATLSAGVAAFPACAGGRAELLEAADAALYASKRAGRNRCTAAPARG
jgi:diguanylate cyclase (GGDEF)-like protein